MFSSKKIILLLIVCLLTIFISQYPVYYASHNTPPGFFFTGQASWFDPWDINVYVSTIKYGQQHGIFLKNLYSTEDSHAVLYYPLYTIIGYLFRMADPFVIYNSLNVVTSFFLLFVIYIVAFQLMPQSKIRSIYYKFFIIVSTVLGRGISWLVPPSVLPADLFVTSFTFRSALQRPQEAVGTALYIISMIGFYLYLHSSEKKYFYYSWIASTFLILFYPYYILLFFVVNCLFILISGIARKKEKLLLLFVNTGVTGVLSFVYFLHLYNSNFNSAISEIQPKLDFTMLVTGYGIFFVILLISLFTIRKNQEQKIYMVLWSMTGIIFSYLPFGFARFYLRGLFLPLSFLALLLYWQMRSIRNFSYIRYVVIVLFVLIAFPSVIYIFSTRIDETQQNNPWYYLPIEYKYSYNYLADVPEDGILSTYISGNIIPAYTGKKVYLGHTIQTPEFSKRETEVRDFYSGALDEAEAYKFLENNNIHYVYFSHFENEISRNFMMYPFLKQVYVNDKVLIYKLDETYQL